ncbi:hypothetical protein EV44_g0786 [Erysiphe necator]|uniref:5'-3' DNA helicase ZGRF1-like N-terminal domain-containing protein n=1 Tax=Uncinula necator TaxID=52586 RepID=A0A0B1NY88_UNCNE|nr:hypothetical protein EV44_g0786 [Erysiphe necator]
MTSYPISSKSATTPNTSSRSQTTAPVLDFRCLFTRDVQRKQKRWQDGRLKFHTFNKRIMVHDERSNFVGDSYLSSGHKLEEGEELSLEQNGILVQVGEYMGKRDQDLDELVDKRLRIREERAIAKLNSGSLSSSNLAAEWKSSEPIQRRSNSLDVVYPVGQIKNKTISEKLALERQKIPRNSFMNELNGCELPTKRQKRNLSPPKKSTYAQNLMGARVFLTTKNTLSSTLKSQNLLQTSSVMQKSSRITIDLTKDDKNSSFKENNYNKNKDTSNPKYNHHYLAQNLAPPIHESSNEHASRVTRKKSTIPNRNDLSQKNMESHSILAKKDPSIRNLKLNIHSSISAKKKSIFQKEAPKISNPILAAPYNDFETPSEIQLRAVTQKSNSQSDKSLSPTVSEVTINLENSEIECNSASSVDNYPTKYVKNKTKNMLRLKSRPPRKLMFMESPLDGTIARDQAEQNRHGKLEARIKKKKLEAKVSSCITPSDEVLSTSDSSTLTQENQTKSLDLYHSNVIYDHTGEIESGVYPTSKDSCRLISKTKAFHKSRFSSKNVKSTADRTPVSEKLPDLNHKILRLEQNHEIGKPKYFKSDVPQTVKTGVKSHEQILQGVGKFSLNKEPQSTKLSCIDEALKLDYFVPEDDTSCQIDTLIAPITSNSEATKSLPKTLLSNPATRGIPLHAITASTIDALNIVGDLISPSSRSLSRVEESFSSNNTSNSLKLESSSTIFGPWSRESFDLFGITKPP